MNAKPQYKPDPAAEFGAAISLYTACKRQAKDRELDLSEIFNGQDEHMRRCIIVAREYEAWACSNIAFDKLNDIWPYMLEDNFGECVLKVLKVGALKGDITEYFPEITELLLKKRCS